MCILKHHNKTLILQFIIGADLMKNNTELLSKYYLRYWIVFDAEVTDEKYKAMCINPIFDYKNELHLFDKQLEKILPAIWYCLQLPRYRADVLDDVDVRAIDKYDSISHLIKIVPKGDLGKFMIYSIQKQMKPTLIICQDSCYNGIKQIIKEESELGVVSVSSLSTNLLNIHWSKIADYMKNKFSHDVKYTKRRLFVGDERRVIPILFILNRMLINDSYYDDLLIHNSQEELFIAQINIRKHINKCLKFAGENQQKYNKGITVVLTLPGTGFSKNLNLGEIPLVEKDVIRLIGTHKAIHNNAALWEFEKLPYELFEELNQLEIHCKNRTRYNNEFVWRKLNIIGKMLAQHIGEGGLKAILCASKIIAFTDFPIGLAILPNTSAPMMCYKPITYKPLTPLTRLLQYQLNDQSKYYYATKCKVLIAECIPKNEDKKKKDTRYYSDLAWQGFMKCFDESKIEIIYCEIKNVEVLKGKLEKFSDIDILIISAHGAYNEKIKKTELEIGEDMWSAEDDRIHLPPFVILSSCHVSPRGSGSVNVADLMLRLGAKVVIGTLVPILVDRNAILVTRLFTYINEALNGSEQFRTLLEAWTWVVASNAIYEIVASSQQLEYWINTPDRRGNIPIKEFQKRANEKQLDLANIYSDTLSILRELAKNDGILGKLDAVINSKGYFPESVFYQLIGEAENVFLYID